MKQNLPVTNQEFPLPVGRMLVSMTDLQGRITYANAAFIDASGFTSEELLGQPHNLVRHPDMPQEAFRDLWATVQAGSPWQGVVKNRRKNGDHYWVTANVAPVRSGNAIVGFLSVRGAPSRAQIDAAEALYRRMHAPGHWGAPKLALQAGMVRRADLPGRLAAFASMQARRWNYDGAAALLCVMATGFLARHADAALWLPAAWAMAAAVWWLAHVRRESALEEIERDTARLASGDLTHVPAVGGIDRLGRTQRALAQVGVNMRAAITDVRAEVIQVGTTVAEIVAGNHELAERTQAQSAGLDQTVASMGQIQATARHTAEEAGGGARMSAHSCRLAEQGRQAIQQAVEGMHGISESSQRIADIVQVIEGVAFQTSILALNAATEAARAGESGRGFAIVAGEVRALAKRTTDAAREIRTLIGTAATKVAAGAEQTHAAQAAMVDAQNSVTAVGAMLSRIDAAARDQLQRVEQVNAAAADIDGATQRNAAMVEELAASAECLNAQVEVLTRAMQVFRVNADDGAPTRPAESRTNEPALNARLPARPAPARPAAAQAARRPASAWT